MSCAMRRFAVIAVALLALIVLSSACAGEEHQQQSLQSQQVGEHGDQQQSSQTGHAEGGGEGEEDGSEYARDAEYDQVRKGARLIIRYDEDEDAFIGTVENTTGETLERVRVEVHLSNGVELGPTSDLRLAPGESGRIRLNVGGENFETWSAHAEVGRDEHAAQAEQAQATVVLDRIRVQLDWTPNTNHTGIYVAEAKGWYADERIDVEILPYSGTSGDLLVAEGAADIAFSFATVVPFSRSQGLDVVSIAAVLQKSPTEIAVLEGGPIKRLRDMDGQLYAGWGLPYEQPQWRTVIQADGGEGTAELVVLDTGAYDALLAGRVQAVEIFVTWEGLDWDRQGIEYRTWRYDDYGVPDRPEVLLITSTETLTEREDALIRFMRATLKGYEFAVQDPNEAAELLIETAGEDAFPDPDLVFASARLLAEEYYLAADGRWGGQTLEQWSAYPGWLYANGLLSDENGDPLTVEPDWSAHFNTDIIEAARE